MKLKRFAAAFCSAAMLTGAAMVIPAAAADSTALNSFEAIDSNCKLLGRSYYTGEALWFGLTDSGVEFDFTGKKCEIDMSGTSSAFNATNGARVKVYGDGKVMFDECLTENKTKLQTITLDFDKSGKHTVKVLKVSECPQNNVTIEEIRVDSDKITPSENGSHTIEFIGDSITCGYGVDGGLKETFVTSTEDGTKTYAYKTGEYFNADISCVSYSGCGAVSGYTNGDNPNTQNLMKDFYELTGHSWDWYKPLNTTIDNYKWSFDEIPELIVINLGTNDYSYTKNNSDKKKQFRTAYKELIEMVRKNNPGSEILCVLGLMGNDLYGDIETVVAEYKKDTSDKKINCCEIDNIDSAADGFGTDYHPKEASHERAAKTLIKEIIKLYGWTGSGLDLSDPISIGDAIVTVPDVTYTGKAQTPDVTVKVGTKTLKKDTDYTTAYADNTKIGKATVTVTGKGDYKGSTTATFNINAISIKDAKVTGLGAKIYTGKAITPAVTVKLGGKTLKKDTDYTVTYKNNIKAGTASVTIKGAGIYSGTVSKTFTIKAKSVAKAGVTGLASKVYTGKAIKPAVTVKVGGNTLKKGTDYTVSYKNNKKIGKASVTIKGKGNYTGTVTKKFTIKPKASRVLSAKSTKTKKMTVKLRKTANVTGYQITYSTSKKFTKKTTTNVSTKKLTKTISKLKKGKTYYVKVRTYKTVGKTKYYSSYSKYRKVTVK